METRLLPREGCDVKCLRALSLYQPSRARPGPRRSSTRSGNVTFLINPHSEQRERTARQDGGQPAITRKSDPFYWGWSLNVAEKAVSFILNEKQRIPSADGEGDGKFHVVDRRFPTPVPFLPGASHQLGQRHFAHSTLPGESARGQRHERARPKGTRTRSAGRQRLAEEELPKEHAASPPFSPFSGGAGRTMERHDGKAGA